MTEPTKVFHMASDSSRTIIRVAARDKEHPYVMIARATLQDSRLSFQARGMLTYILSKPDNWSVRITDLMQEGGIGRNQADNIMKELKNLGYVTKDRARNEHGRWEPGLFLVYETPQSPPTDDH